MPGFLTNGLPMLGQLGAGMRIPVDTLYRRGANPESVAASALQVAATLVECTANATTSTAAAATSNTFGGVTTTEALTTAVGATYTFTLTNSQITAAYVASGAVPTASIVSGTNTGGALPPDQLGLNMTLVSVTPATGSCVFVWRNDGTTVLNGTTLIVWHL